MGCEGVWYHNYHSFTRGVRNGKCITIQNYVQGPNRFDLKCSHEYVQNLYRKFGFEDITLLKKYVKYDNIRKYLSPLKFERESKISKILWGKGFVEYIGKKIDWKDPYQKYYWSATCKAV